MGVAQLAERWLVEPEVAGSSPVVHPTRNGPTSVGPFLFKLCKAGPVEQTLEETVLDELTVSDQPWITLVWNDPVNLMSYVSWVFRSYFGVDRPEAERLMLQVHNDGKAVVATGGREEMERHVQAMHGFGLWASIQKGDE